MHMLTKHGYVLMNDPLFLTVAQAAVPVKFYFTAWSESL